MPVEGTPVPDEQPTGLEECSAQVRVEPVVATVYRCPVKARRRAVEVAQGVAKTLDWTMLSPDGDPVDLSSCGSFDGEDSSGVTLRFKETILLGCGDPDFTLSGTVTDAAAGAVSFPLTTTHTAKPGVYIAEATVVNGDGLPVFVNQFHLIVNRGLAATTPRGAPPTIAEIRLHLRDSDPAESLLLETVQFDAAEIAHAIEQPVLYWNESMPPIDQRWTTTSFPYRFHWMEGVVARLYLTAAHWYRRNHLPHQAGGVAVDDLNKAAEYEKVGQEKWAEYKQWVLKVKVSINCGAAVQSSGGFYGRW